MPGTIRTFLHCTTVQSGPLQIHRPLYLQVGAPPVVYLKTPSSGLLDGDEHQISLDIAAGSSLELRTQACMLVYPGTSRQLIEIRVGDGGKLVFHPHLMIMGAGSDLVQSVKIDLAEGASLDYCEQWCAGRIAMGEKWRFHKFDYRIHILSMGKLIYRERWCIKPAEHPLEHPLICGGFTHFRSRYQFGDVARDVPEVQAETSKDWTLLKESGRISKMAYSQRTAGSAS